MINISVFLLKFIIVTVMLTTIGIILKVISSHTLKCYTFCCSAQTIFVVLSYLVVVTLVVVVFILLIFILLLLIAILIITIISTVVATIILAPNVFVVVLVAGVLFEETCLLPRISRIFSVVLTLNFAFLPRNLMVSHIQGFCSLCPAFVVFCQHFCS
jgi:hypothetical protein